VAAGLRSDARHNEARLKEAALLVFSERGLGATLLEIADRAGVSEGTLYNRFGGRNGLIDAVLPDLLAVKLAHVLESARHEQDPWSRLGRFVELMAELQTSDPAFCDVVLGRFADSAQVQAITQDMLDTAAELIAEAQAAGVVDLALVPDDIGDLLIAVASLLHAHGSQEGPERVRRHVAYFLDGVKRD
jgi:AcrR family transcriptional regulator